MKMEKVNIGNVLIVGGLIFIGYWVYKMATKPNVIDSQNDVSNKPDTTYVSIGNNRVRKPILPSRTVKDYNATPFATVSPAMVTINEKSPFA